MLRDTRALALILQTLAVKLISVEVPLQGASAGAKREVDVHVASNEAQRLPDCSLRGVHLPRQLLFAGLIVEH